MVKNRILFGFIFFLSLVFVYFYGGKLPYMLFYMTIILPILSLLYTLYVFFRFKYAQHLENRIVTKGDKIQYSFTVQNEDLILYPYIKVYFHSADTIFANQFQARSFSLLPRKKKTFKYELTCIYRGRYPIGIEKIEFIDFLGIFKFQYINKETKYLKVYPKIISLSRLNIRNHYLSESHTALANKYEDSTNVSDVRKYVYGDSFRKIHWKLTSKTNKLMVKNFQSTSETSAILMLDLKINKYASDISIIIEDKLIEAYVSIVNYCLSHWIPTNLVYFENELVQLSAKSPLDFETIYGKLAELKFVANVDITDIMDINSKDTIQKTNLMLFTTNIDYNLYNELYKLKLAGYEISIVYVSPEDATGTPDYEVDSILASLPEMGVFTYKINASDDLKVVMER